MLSLHWRGWDIPQQTVLFWCSDILCTCGTVNRQYRSVWVPGAPSRVWS